MSLHERSDDELKAKLVSEFSGDELVIRPLVKRHRRRPL